MNRLVYQILLAAALGVGDVWADVGESAAPDDAAEAVQSASASGESLFDAARQGEYGDAA